MDFFGTISNTFYTNWNILIGWVLAIIPVLLKVAVILVAGFFVTNFIVKLLKKFLLKSKVEIGVTDFLCLVSKTALRVIVVMVAASELGIDLNAIFVTMGAASVALGLALKSTVENFTSGVIIMFNKPFIVGDFMELDGLIGTVQKIELMYTTLLTPDNKAILIPNSIVNTSKIINYSKQPTRRLDLEFSISYSDNIEQAKQVVRSVVEANAKTLTDPVPTIVVAKHGAHSVGINAMVWCNGADYLPLKFELMESVKVAFDANGIAIPFNQMDVHIINK